jgi:hypothetical protein
MSEKQTRNRSPRERTFTGTQEQTQFEPFRRGDDIITYAGAVRDDANKIKRIKSDEQLDSYIRRNPEGAVAVNIKQMNLAVVDFETDKYTISKPLVQDAAKRFVAETLDAGGSNIGGAVGSDFSFDYRIEGQLIEARERLSETWTTVDVDSLTKWERQQLIETEKKYQAQAILESARIGNVKLTDAQYRRLRIASQGDYFRLLGEKRPDPTKRAHFNKREKAQWLEEFRRGNF